MPCTAKKFEAARPELGHDGAAGRGHRHHHPRAGPHDQARAASTSPTCPTRTSIALLGESTGAGVIFGATGGVMEAALRTAYEVVTGKTLEQRRVRRRSAAWRASRKPSIDLNGMDVNVAVAHSHRRRRPSCSTCVKSRREELHTSSRSWAAPAAASTAAASRSSPPEERDLQRSRACCAPRRSTMRTQAKTMRKSPREPRDQEDLRRVPGQAQQPQGARAAAHHLHRPLQVLSDRRRRGQPEKNTKADPRSLSPRVSDCRKTPGELERAAALSNFQSRPAACTVGTGRFLRRKIPFSREKIVSLQSPRPKNL